MLPTRLRLFIKPGCPWCDDALDWFAARGIAHETLDVTSDRRAWDEMRQLTGQTKAPCLDANGEVLADFGVDELEPWWEDRFAK